MIIVVKFIFSVMCEIPYKRKISKKKSYQYFSASFFNFSIKDLVLGFPFLLKAITLLFGV